MGSLEAFFMGMATALVLGGAAYALFLVLRDRNRAKQILKEQKESGFDAKLRLAKSLLAQIEHARSPEFDLYHVASDAMSEFITDAKEVSRGHELETRDVFGHPASIPVGHYKMAEFAKKHLAHQPFVAKNDVRRISEVSWWASQREALVISIRALYTSKVLFYVNAAREAETARFGSNEAQKATALMVARIRGAATSSSEIQKSVREEQARIMADDELTDDEKGAICNSIERLGEVEVLRITRKMGID